MEGRQNVKSVSTSSAPEAIGPYSQGVVAHDILFISGQLPIDPRTGKMTEGNIQAKTRQVIQNVEAVAEAAGASLDRVVKITVFLKDMANFVAVNEVYAQYFERTLPARSAVQVAALPKDADIEMEAIALIG